MIDLKNESVGRSVEGNIDDGGLCIQIYLPIVQEENRADRSKPNSEITGKFLVLNFDGDEFLRVGEGG